MAGGSLWSNSRQFIGVTANTRAGEKVFKFLRLEFINCNLVKVTRANISFLTKMAKLVIWTWTGSIKPTNECTSKNVLTNLENLLARGCGNARGGPCHRKDLGKDQHT